MTHLFRQALGETEARRMWRCWIGAALAFAILYACFGYVL